jgi:maleylacetate reductase
MMENTRYRFSGNESVLPHFCAIGRYHSINAMRSARAHPLASLLAEKAIHLYVENLPMLKDRSDLQALSNCQLATWYTGIGQMYVPHGFSQWMDHMLAPWLGCRTEMRHPFSCRHRHARWRVTRTASRGMCGICWADRDRSPTTSMNCSGNSACRASLRDLGLSGDDVEQIVQPALRHPQVAKNNLRSITAAAHVRAALALADHSAFSGRRQRS